MDALPVAILGGSDRRPGPLPAASGLHPLNQYKGIALKVGGRPLVAHLVERLAAAGFGPVSIAGPARIYAPLELAAELVDTDRDVAANLRAAVEHHGRRGPGPMALLACDVLPTAQELARVRDLWAESPRADLWLPFVRFPRRPEALGAFGWKPTYHLEVAGEGPLDILPGHLGIFDPGALRLPLLYRLLGIAYRTRNHSVAVRRAAMLRASIVSLLGRDLGGLLRLRAPTLTWTVVRSGLRLARNLRAGRLSLAELERLIGRIFLRRGQGGTGVRLPVTDVLSLALDVDTEEEARELLSGDER